MCGVFGTHPPPLGAFRRLHAPYGYSGGLLHGAENELMSFIGGVTESGMLREDPGLPVSLARHTIAISDRQPLGGIAHG